MKFFYIVVLLTIYSATGAEVSFVSSNNLFAASLHKEVSKTISDNFLVSSFSAELVLALLQSGAKGKTAQELQDCLHLPHDQEQIKSLVKTTLATLPHNNEYHSFYTANKIYALNNYHINEEFTKTAVESFSAEIENIDFSKNVEAAQTMNKWVEDHTNNKIHNLIKPESLDGKTRLVLINSLYFQASWQKAFDNYTTKVKNFHVNATKKIEVPTMNQEAHYKYFENADLKAKFLEIPFEITEASMTFVLPNEKDGLHFLESNIEKVFAPQNFSIKLVDVELPKFKIESSVNLKEVLTQLGVTSVFNDADLGGIADDGLFVSEAVQKTFISVKEEGVEAAAATAAIISLRISQDSSRLIPKTFHADHPFLFYIKMNNIIIFSGRVVLPNEIN